MHVAVTACCYLLFDFFFFNDTATTEIYTLSLHDALPISADRAPEAERDARPLEGLVGMTDWLGMAARPRSPHPELKARVLARALERRRGIAPLAAAAALLLVLAGGGGGPWGPPTIPPLCREPGN